MTTLVIVRPSGLLADELRQALAASPTDWDDIKLLSDVDEDVGTLTEIDGNAAIVQRLTSENLQTADSVILCGELSSLQEALDQIPSSSVKIALGSASRSPGAIPTVAGINSEGATLSSVLVSPEPAVVGLAHLLEPLRALGLAGVTATVLQPASTHDKAGLDEVFEQTQSILAFDQEQPRTVFGAQMAFNVLPSRVASGARSAADLKRILGFDGTVSIAHLQVGVFHNVGISLHLTFEQNPGLDAVNAALDSVALVRRFDQPDLLGPIEASGDPHLLLGEVKSDEGHYALWCVMDNLTVGAALNAVALLRELESRHTN